MVKKRVVKKIKTEPELFWGFKLILHLLLFVAIIYIHFSSPIEEDLEPVEVNYKPPAKRVVLIIGDGLKYSSIFGSEVNAPNLLAIRDTRGHWGVSVTRMPTESRPGHAAILGGVNEDPSAIFKGWQASLVDFDTVLNESAAAFGWGSPDILPLFYKEKMSHIHIETYPSSMQNFGNDNTTLLDLWVFEAVEKFLEKERDCPSCKRRDKTIIVLHLLGIDTAGHVFKPNSIEYKENIRVVDEYIPKLERLFNETYGDNLTSFVFTSDHGMTLRGSHGSGTEDEILTPILAWGAGIKHDLVREEIKQVDIAPLLSSLIGISIPTNSLGILPCSFLNVTTKVAIKMLSANIQQLYGIFHKKEQWVQNHAPHYVPFSHNVEMLYRISKSENQMEMYTVNLFKSNINSLILGIDYYRTYFNIPIKISIAIGFIAFICYEIMFIIKEVYITKTRKVQSPRTNFIFGAITFVITTILLAYNLPPLFYVYFLFPIFMCYISYMDYMKIREIKEFIETTTSTSYKNMIYYFFIIELMTIGFEYPATFSMAVWMIGAWPRIMLSNKRVQLDEWYISTFALGFYNLISFITSVYQTTYYCFGCVVFLYFALHMLEISHHPKVLIFQTCLCGAASVLHLVVKLKAMSINSGWRNLSWILSILGVLAIFKTNTSLVLRLHSIILGFMPYFIMTTVSADVLFIIIYLKALCSWLEFESKLLEYTTLEGESFTRPIPRFWRLELEDFRRSLFFMVFLFMGFFGLGNVASFNTFDPMWVRCFVTSFKPFLMTILIIIKILIPLLFAVIFYKVVTYLTSGKFSTFFRLPLLIGDIMLLHFFFWIKSDGSWLDIGVSVTHFLIMQCFTFALLFLFSLTKIITTFSLVK